MWTGESAWQAGVSGRGARKRSRELTCREMDAVISSHWGTAVLAPDAAGHVLRCGVCRRLIRVLDEGGQTPRPSGSQIRRIRAAVAADLKPVRPVPPPSFFLFACGIILVCVTAAAALQFGMNGWAALSIARRIAVFSAIAGLAAILSTSLVRQMTPASKHVFDPVALPGVILAVLVFVIGALFRSREESAFVANGLGCMKNGLTSSIPAAFLFWLLLRHGAILYPKLAGAATGGLAGLTGLSALELNCPNLNVFHILVWHWSVVFIGTVAGTLLGAAVEYIERRSNRRVLRACDPAR